MPACLYAKQCDADGGIISPQSMGMPEGLSDITEVIVDLSEANSKTTTTMVHVIVPEGSAGGVAWNQAFDRPAGALGPEA